MPRSLLNLLFISFFLLTAASVYSQKSQSVWYFGNRAGIRFEKDGSVTVFGNSLMSAFEGCASVADNNGNLLFYTDGTSVWNKNHQVIANDLKGNASSSQSAIIVPKPGDTNRYYIFTSNGVSGNTLVGCYYSEVNMDPAFGAGTMTTVRNVKLAEPADEKITAVGHRNGKDIWVLVPIRGSDVVYSYLVTENGVSASPVVNNTGLTGNFTGELGYIKTSIKGNKVAMANLYASKIFVMDFDNSTGKCSNAYSFDAASAYGVEFSPSGQFLYVSTDRGQLDQYDLYAGSANQVQQSKFPLFKLGYGGALQIAVNKKIYMSSYSSLYLACISEPDKPRAACMARETGLYLTYGSCAYGLPNLIPTFFSAAIHYQFSGYQDCGRLVSFNLGTGINVEEVVWDFGDPASGIYNISDNVSPSHSYKTAGVYTVTVRYKKEGVWYDLDDKITIEKIPKVSFSMPDTLSKCDQSVTLSYYMQGAAYLWSTGSTDPYLIIDKPGTYSLELTDEYKCKHTDSTVVRGVPAPVLITDTILCAYDSILLSDLSNYPYTQYKWSTGASKRYIYGKPGKTYILEVYDKAGCLRRDTAVLAEFPQYDIALGKDSMYCGPFSRELVIQYRNSHTTRWSTGSKEDVITVSKPGQYTVEVKDRCYTLRDTFNAEVFDALPQLGADTEKCLVNPVRLQVYTNKYHILWNTGDTSKYIDVSEPGEYWVRMFKQQCSSSDTITIKQAAGNNLNMYFPNAFSPDNNRINDHFPSAELPYDIDDISIYSRWGDLLFHGSGTRQGWDGRYMGELVTEGVYLYTATYRDCDGNRHHLKGTVSVFR